MLLTSKPQPWCFSESLLGNVIAGSGQSFLGIFHQLVGIRHWGSAVLMALLNAWLGSQTANRSIKMLSHAFSVSHTASFRSVCLTMYLGCTTSFIFS